MLLTPAFREEVLARQKVLRGSASVHGGVVEVRQVQASRGLPSFATKVVGDEIEIVQVERWDGDRADVEVSIPGKPGEMSGHARLSEAGGRTTETVELRISVRIPLVGGKIEGLIGEMMGKALDKEQEVGAAWLAR